MPLLSEEDRKALQDRFAETLEEDVKIRLFTQSSARSMLTLPGEMGGGGQAGELAKLTQDLLQELTELSPKVHLDVLDVFGDGADEAKRMDVDRIPAIVLGDDDKGRVRFYGAPVGNEFPTILAGIEALSTSKPLLREPVAEAAIERITDDVHLRVFVTPT